MRLHDIILDCQALTLGSACRHYQMTAGCLTQDRSITCRTADNDFSQVPVGAGVFSMTKPSTLLCSVVTAALDTSGCLSSAAAASSQAASQTARSQVTS